MIIKKYSVVLVLCSLLFGCNTEQLPPDTRVLIAPREKQFTVTVEDMSNVVCFTDGGSYQDVPLLIAVTDGQNAPIGDAEVGVYTDFAANTSNGPDMLQLYSDNNGNGVIDGPEELVSGAASGVHKAKTDTFHGTTMLILRMYLTCPYSGDVFAFVGASTYTMNVGVSYTTRGEQTNGGETDSGGTTDGGTGGGTTDGGTTDTGTTDSGTTDSGTTDTGTTDTGTTDSGTSIGIGTSNGDILTSLTHSGANGE